MSYQLCSSRSYHGLCIVCMPIDTDTVMSQYHSSSHNKNNDNNDNDNNSNTKNTIMSSLSFTVPHNNIRYRPQLRDGDAHGGGFASGRCQCAQRPRRFGTPLHPVLGQPPGGCCQVWHNGAGDQEAQSPHFEQSLCSPVDMGA